MYPNKLKKRIKLSQTEKEKGDKILPIGKEKQLNAEPQTKPATVEKEATVRAAEVTEKTQEEKAEPATEQQQDGEELAGVAHDIEQAVWYDELTDKDTEEEIDLPSWKNGIYIGDARTEDKYPLEYMVNFFRNKHVDFYVKDYLIKCKEGKADSPEKKRILLFDRVDYRHLETSFGKHFFYKERLD